MRPHGLCRAFLQIFWS
jgi:hypothetical protein